MKNRWDDKTAQDYARQSPLGLRVYSSQLLGQEPDLVLHGGGNTSVKGEQTNLFGETERLLYVKGSGWDLRTIEARGFPPVKLDYLLKLGQLETLSDSEMMRQLRLALLDPAAPTPSVEAILHALIPHRYVDHSHADAVVAISNTADGETVLRRIYGDDVLILSYTMPGFILARQVAAATAHIDWNKIKGIVLLHHGIFTFDEDAKASYERMIELVSKAEDFLADAGATTRIATGDNHPTQADCLALSNLRHQVSRLLSAPALLRLDSSADAVGFASLAEADELVVKGPLTPDHTIHTKAFAAVFGKATNDAEGMEHDLQNFVRHYQKYFSDHALPQHKSLDCMPRWGLWQNKGLIYFAANIKRLQIVADITAHTIKAMQWGETLGGWQALPMTDLFAVEYWELEQAKLKSAQRRLEFEGKIALVTGAASGIGKAAVEELLRQGAVVAALDIDPAVSEISKSAALLAIQCDVTDGAAIDQAIQRTVLNFGGLDIVVSNAGNFPASQNLEDLDDSQWSKSIALNLSSHMQLIRACVPFLKNGLDPAIVINASKNVPAPGPGAGAYSVAKAGLTQMARVAALELGGDGIRVNTIHPNAVYDTAIWTEKVLADRAQRYHLTVEEYKRNNVLKTEVGSADVAKLVCLLAGTSMAKTTGAQIPVDGGNERVI